jgi:hypothetical protein
LLACCHMISLTHIPLPYTVRTRKARSSAHSIGNYPRQLMGRHNHNGHDESSPGIQDSSLTVTHTVLTQPVALHHSVSQHAAGIGHACKSMPFKSSQHAHHASRVCSATLTIDCAVIENTQVKIQYIAYCLCPLPPPAIRSPSSIG